MVVHICKFSILETEAGLGAVWDCFKEAEEGEEEEKKKKADEEKEEGIRRKRYQYSLGI